MATCLLRGIEVPSRMSSRSKLMLAELQRQRWRMVALAELGFVALSKLAGVANEETARAAFSPVRMHMTDTLADETSQTDSLAATIGARLRAVREERMNLERVARMGGKPA